MVIFRSYVTNYQWFMKKWHGVDRNANSLTELNAATVCSTYASGWEVPLEPLESHQNIDGTAVAEKQVMISH